MVKAGTGFLRANNPLMAAAGATVLFIAKCDQPLWSYFLGNNDGRKSKDTGFAGVFRIDEGTTGKHIRSIAEQSPENLKMISKPFDEKHIKRFSKRSDFPERVVDQLTKFWISGERYLRLSYSDWFRCVSKKWLLSSRSFGTIAIGKRCRKRKPE